MQVIEVSVRNEYKVYRWQFADANPGSRQALQDKNPFRKVGIDYDVQTVDLYEETGMPDKRDAHLACFRQYRTTGLTCAWRKRRVAHQLGELLGLSADGDIQHRLHD
jgi:hypothetical protein